MTQPNPARNPSFSHVRRLAAAAMVLTLTGCVTTSIRSPQAGAAPAPTPGPIARASGMRLVPTDATPVPRPSIEIVSDPGIAAEFNNLRKGGDFFFGGWPTEAGLRAMAAQGVRKVVCLKTADEVIAARGYDPRVVAAELGMEFIELPVTADSLSDAYVAKFAAEIESKSTGKTLIHCGAGGTCGMVWGSYLASRKGLDPAKALAEARAAGLLDGPQAEAAERYVQAVAERRKGGAGSDQ